MDLKTIIVVWMDGVQATYPDCTTNIISDTLHIYLYLNGDPKPAGEWHFPLGNIRAWGPRPWRADSDRSIG